MNVFIYALHDLIENILIFSDRLSIMMYVYFSLFIRYRYIIRFIIKIQYKFKLCLFISTK